MVVALAAVTAEASQRSGGGHAPVRRTVNTVLAIFLAIVAAIGGVVLGSRLAAVVNIGAAGAGESPTAGESAAPAPAATAPPTPAPRATPSPAPTPTASPAPTATPAPTASPKPSRTPSPTPSLLTHRVKRGETLTIIAAKYGVTVTALQRANGIKNPSLIITGQLLVIPAH
jgi:LysM repeat protein